MGLFYLGCGLGEGKLVNPDRVKGMAILRDGAAAGDARINAECAYKLACCLEADGDYKEAVRFYEQAAAPPHCSGCALCNLAAMTASGRGVEPDLVEAWRLALKARAEGQPEAEPLLAKLKPHLERLGPSAR